MKYTLRKATLEDANKLLRWKNDYTVRKYSIASNERIKKENHIRWLKKNIDKIQIITDGKIDYGDIRLTDEIAIKIDKKYRGKGIGDWAIKQVKGDYVAKIVDGNVCSMRLFIKNGYLPVKYKFKKGVFYYELRKQYVINTRRSKYSEQ